MPQRTTEWDRWVRIGPKVQRNLVIEAEGLELVRYRVEPGHSVRLHKHHGAQIGVLISGAGVHRFVLNVEKNGRTRRVTTEIPVLAGDCYYIPPDVPHAFDCDPRRPVVLIGIMVRPPSVRAGAASSARGSRGARRRPRRAPARAR